MTAYINGRDVPDREALHRTLAEQLQFPDYYGNNLDALYDLLTASAQPVEITVAAPEKLEARLGGYFDLFLAVLRDAGEDGGNVRLTLETPDDSDPGDLGAYDTNL